MAYHYSDELVKLGHEVTVFTPRYSKVEKQEEKNFKFKHSLPLARYGNAAFVPQLFWQLNEFDIVHLHYPFFGGAEVVWLWKKFHPKKKLIITYHMDVVGQGMLGGFFRWHTKYWMPKILKLADKIIVSSFDYLEHSALNKFFVQHKEKFIVLPFGVDDRFQPQDKDQELLKKYNLSPSDKTILFVGGLDRAHYFKGLEYLFQALRFLQDKNYKLFVVGDGDLKKHYQEVAKDLNISEQVIFTGRVADEDLVKYYNLCDLFVLPSIDKSEAFGLVLLEAMACAKPVVASNLPGVRSVFEDGKQGYFMESKNVDDLKNKIKVIFSDEEKRKLMGLAARQLVEEKYDWERVVERVMQIYK